MTGRAEQAFVRYGVECVHVAPAGSRFMSLGGGRFLVTHPERPAYVANPDGSLQVCLPGSVVYCEREYWRVQ